MSFTATNSSGSERSTAARTTCRPMRPNPLMPTRSAISILSLLADPAPRAARSVLAKERLCHLDQLRFDHARAGGHGRQLGRAHAPPLENNHATVLAARGQVHRGHAHAR